MSTDYEISGASKIGTIGFLNEFFGDLSLSNVTVSGGSMLTNDINNNLIQILPPANTSVLICNTLSQSDSLFEWRRTATVGEILQITAPNTISWSNSNIEASTFGLMVHKNTNLTIAAPATTATNINGWGAPGLGTGEWNTTGGRFSGITGIMNIPTDGTYFINCGVKFLNSNNVGTKTLRVLRNNTVPILSAQWEPTANVDAFQSRKLAGVVRLNQNDRIVMQMFQSNANTASNITVVAGKGTWFSVVKMSN